MKLLGQDHDKGYMLLQMSIMSHVSPCRKVWLARWAESANEVHLDMSTGKSGEGAGSAHGSVTMDTGTRGSEGKDTHELMSTCPTYTVDYSLAALNREVCTLDEATPTSVSLT